MHGHSLDAGAYRHSGTRQEMTTARGRAGQRPHPAASALRLPDPEAPLRPLHAGAGLAGVRLHSGGAGAGGGAAVRQLRPRADQRRGLRAGLDPAHDRRADDPHRRHPPAPARQHGPAGRRHHGDAGPLHHPGLDRSGDAVRRACRATCRSRAPTEQHETLDSYVEHEGLPTGYWANFRKFVVSLLKAWYGDAATPENDFGFSWLPRVDADYSQLPYFDRMSKGEVKGYFLFGQNPAGGAPNARPAPRGTAQPRLAGGARLVRDRERRLLEGRPGRPAARRHQDRSVLHPGRGRAGEGGQPHQHPADAPVARQGARPAGRQPLRRLVPLQPRQAPQAALRRLDRSQGPAAASPHLGLRVRRAAATARREPQPDRGGAGPGEGAHGDQRVPAGPDRTRAPAGRASSRGSPSCEDDGTTACGCWIYSGVFPEPGRNRARERQAHLQSAPARVGLRLAAQPPHPLQPRVGGSRGPSVVGAKEADLVGRASRAGGSAPTSRTSIPRCRRTTGRRPAPRG